MWLFWPIGLLAHWPSVSPHSETACVCGALSAASRYCRAAALGPNTLFSRCPSRYLRPSSTVIPTIHAAHSPGLERAKVWRNDAPTLFLFGKSFLCFCMLQSQLRLYSRCLAVWQSGSLAYWLTGWSNVKHEPVKKQISSAGYPTHPSHSNFQRITATENKMT